jgi:molybdate transport system substrate-binding protein
MKRRTPFILIVLLATLLAACGPAATTVPTQVPPTVTQVPPTATPVPPTATPEPRTLTVFAASSLTDAFTEIGHNFEAANPNVTVTFSFAGSQTLRTQLEEGAVADVFASANTKEMDTLVTDNLVPADSSQVFLTNQLLVILPANNPANIQSLADLTKSGLKIVLAADTVPVGKYALQVLENLNALYGTDYKDKVLANVVSQEDNVKQVVTKVQMGEADAGIVYISDAVAAPDMKTIEIPADNNVIAKYPIATLIGATQPELAKAFIAYVLSADGQATLKNWGFTPVNP